MRTKVIALALSATQTQRSASSAFRVPLVGELLVLARRLAFVKSSSARWWSETIWRGDEEEFRCGMMEL